MKVRKNTTSPPTEDSESRRPIVGEEQYRCEKWRIGMNPVLLELVVAIRLFLRQIWINKTIDDSVGRYLQR